MTDADWGWIGGIAGGVIGTIGGIIGSWASISNARPRRVRRFMIWAAVAMWLVLAVMMTLIILVMSGVLPKWVIWTTQTVFLLFLGPAIVLTNRHIRAVERTEEEQGGPASEEKT